MTHITVLKEEATQALALSPDSVVVDCTLGAGGHASAIINQLGKDGIYVGIDADISAIIAAEHLKDLSEGEVHLVHGNFKDIVGIVAKLGIPAPTAVLADLGWRSDQFEAGGKGFSFAVNELLAMTYGDPKDYLFTAADIVNEWDESSIADVIYGYGEERASRQIARAIVAARALKPIKTAKELADIVASVVRTSPRSKINPATKTFQALRIAVNDELGVLRKLLGDGFDLLSSHGRMAIISFHSLEDRMVKRFFKELAHDQQAQLITKKPITASDLELADNPRARSAKLRVIEKN